VVLVASSVPPLEIFILFLVYNIINIFPMLDIVPNIEKLLTKLYVSKYFSLTYESIYRMIWTTSYIHMVT
jgi:hypothetical protein